MNQLAPILKKARQALNLTQEDVAKKLGISQRAYAFYEDENLERMPRRKRLEELGKVLSIPIKTVLKHYNGELEEEIYIKEQKPDVPTPEPRDTPLTGAHVTLQDHIDLLKDYNEKLFALLSSNLGNLQEGQRIMIAYQKAWVDHAAEQESAGDPDRKEEIKYRFGKLVDDILHRGSLSGTQTGSGKQSKG